MSLKRFLSSASLSDGYTSGRQPFRHGDERCRAGGGFWGGVILSVLLHALVVFLLLYHVAESPPPPSPSVEMVFESGQVTLPSAKAPHPAAVPAPPAPVEAKAPPAPEPPKERQPPSPPPPVPPPPPRASSAPEPGKTVAETAIHQREDVHEKGEISPKPHPQPVPTPHAAQLKGPVHKVKTSPKKPLASHTEQQHEPPKAQADSHALLSTLASFRSEQKQEHPPHATPNPLQGGALRGGGSPDGDTRALSVSEQKAIGASVRRCYQEDTAARNYATFMARLVVTVDASGVARMAVFAPDTASRMATDPSYRALAERARAAVLSPSCSRLPVPARLLGQTRQFHFVFRP